MGLLLFVGERGLHMQLAVVPAQNEGERIQRVLTNLLALPLDKIIVVVNGSQDNTLAQAQALKDSKIEILYFHESLGLDVPRAIGAKRAVELGATAVLFQDGDMVGNFKPHQQELLNAIKKGTDVALTDCYPFPPPPNSLLKQTLDCRKRLNQALGFFEELGYSTPSHGPHALSQKALQTIPLRDLAIPPLILVHAKLLGLKVKVATKLPHQELGSSIRGVRHAEKISQTICGDCLEALAFYQGRLRERKDNNANFLGYHGERNFALLDEILALNSLEKFVACNCQ